MPFDAAKAPPRISASTAKEAAVERRQRETLSKKTKERAEGLLGYGQMAAFGCVLKGWFADAGTINKFGPGFCVEIARLGETNEKIAESLDKLNAAGPVAAVLAAALPMAMQFLANHGKVTAEAVAGFGVVSPEALAAEAKAEMMKQQAEAIRMQREAELELAQLTAELEQSPNGVAPHA